jgi:hypothetical protein
VIASHRVDDDAVHGEAHLAMNVVGLRHA